MKRLLGLALFMLVSAARASEAPMQRPDADEGNDSASLCHDQTANCESEALDTWPKSNLRLGFTLLAEADVSPFLRERPGGAMATGMSLPFGLEGSAKVFGCRLSVLVAPAALHFNTGKSEEWWRPSRLIGYDIYFLFHRSFMNFAIGMPKYDWRVKYSPDWKETTIGMWIAVLRFPAWGEYNWLPELRHQFQKKKAG